MNAHWEVKRIAEGYELTIIVSGELRLIELGAAALCAAAKRELAEKRATVGPLALREREAIEALGGALTRALSHLEAAARGGEPHRE